MGPILTKICWHGYRLVVSVQRREHAEAFYNAAVLGGCIMSLVQSLFRRPRK